MYRYFKPIKGGRGGEENLPLLPKATGNHNLNPASVRAANEEVLALGDGAGARAASHAAHSHDGKAGKKRRGMYGAYSAELRAKIGRYAAENGTAAACKKFSKEQARPICESTIRGMKSAYIKVINSNPQAEINELPRNDRGRPLLLGKYDDDVKAYIRGIRQAGGAVSSKVVLAGTRGLLQNKNPPILAEHGGHVTLDKTWARSLLNRMGFTKRKGTKGVKTRPDDFAEVGGKFWRRIGRRVRQHEIPDELIINWDQTGVNIVPGGEWTLEQKGVRQVPLKGIDDKRQYTVLLACSLAGDFLPPQVLYQGKTDRCHPNTDFPDDWDVWHTESHWSTTGSMLRYLDTVIQPYVTSTQQYLETASPPLLICDVFRAHTCGEVRERIKALGALLVYVPAACSDLLQPLDATVNRRYKQELSEKFQMWYAEKVAAGMAEGKEISDIAKGIDLRTAVLKPIHAKWLIATQDIMRHEQEVIQKGWEVTGITKAVTDARDAPVPPMDDSDAEGDCKGE